MQQCGPPLEVYDRPANRFVASFIGTPAMNFIAGQLRTDAGGQRWFESAGVRVPMADAGWDEARVPPVAGDEMVGLVPHPTLRTSGRQECLPHPGEKCVLGIRPEHFQITAAAARCRGPAVEHFRHGRVGRAARQPDGPARSIGRRSLLGMPCARRADRRRQSGDALRRSWQRPLVWRGLTPGMQFSLSQGERGPICRFALTLTLYQGERGQILLWRLDEAGYVHALASDRARGWRRSRKCKALERRGPDRVNRWRTRSSGRRR